MKTIPPSTHGPDGRGDKGRFLPGNHEGRGNPLAGKVAKLRAVMVASIGAKDLRIIVKKVVSLAKAGDLAAAKVVFERSVGPPEAVDLVERLEALENVILRKGKP